MEKKSAGQLPQPVTVTAVPQRKAWTTKRAIGATFLVALLYLQYSPSVPRTAWKDHRALQQYHSALSPHCKPPASQHDIESILIDTPTADSARNASHSLSAVAHIAGTEGDRLSALLVKEQWEHLLNLPLTPDTHNLFESGTPASRRALTGRSGCKHQRRRNRLHRIKQKLGFSPHKRPSQQPRVFIDTYHPLLNYPVSHSLTLTPPGAATPSFIAKLIEDDVSEDKQSKQGRIDIPTFHGLSKNGSASAQLVYAGHGTKKEFIDLAALGVDFKGKIAIVQYSGSFRGLKVQAATEAGCVACIIFTDPIEDGEITEANGHLPYPHGPARQPSSVQRGSVQFLSSYPGDPLTPHSPAYANATRLDRDDPTLNMPSIPSLPISYEDALPLLASLEGKGIQLAKGGLNVGYWTGPGDDTVDLVNIMDDKITPIWNTMAVIPGHLDSEIVVMGSHRDAWNFGAGDPVSGATTVHEVVKGLGALLKTGWKPLRTIVVVSWDAEEYGLIGSTEFGEDFSEYLQENVVAYLNVDVSVAGSAYSVNASPSLADLYRDISSLITDPKNSSQSLSHQVIVDQIANEDTEISTRAAEGELYVGPLGSGSDFTVFLQYLGIASANLGFTRKRTDPVYHYHSIYDSAYWMDKFGDPTFSHHLAIAQVLGLATIRLANNPILPINTTAYAHELAYYSSKVAKIQLENDPVDLTSLDKSINKIIAVSKKLDREKKDVSHELEKLKKHHLPSKKLEKLMRRARSINTKLSSFERGFIDVGGLPGREWYRNLVVAPGRYLGYGATTFPALTESLTLDKDTKQARIEVGRLVKSFDKIAKNLVVGL